MLPVVRGVDGNPRATRPFPGRHEVKELDFSSAPARHHEGDTRLLLAPFFDNLVAWNAPSHLLLVATRMFTSTADATTVALALAIGGPL